MGLYFRVHMTLLMKVLSHPFWKRKVPKFLMAGQFQVKVKLYLGPSQHTVLKEQGKEYVL